MDGRRVRKKDRQVDGRGQRQVRGPRRSLLCIYKPRVVFTKLKEKT